jgi:hypothetical protein
VLNGLEPLKGISKIREADLRSLQIGWSADGRLQRAALAGVIGIVENSVGRNEPVAAAGGVPSQADARCKGLFVGLNQAAGNAGIARIEQAGGSGGENHGLPAGNKKILAIFLFGVRERNFVAKAVVQGEAGRDFVGVLRIEVYGVAAQIAGEVSAALKEDERLAEKKTGEGVAEGYGDEDEKAVAGNALQDVEAVVVVTAAEFHLVEATNPGKRTGEVEIAVIGVARSGDGIADGSESGNLNEWRADGSVERGLVLETQAAGSGVVGVLFKEEAVAQKREARQTDYCGRKRMRFRGHKVLRAMLFADGKSGNVRAGRGKRIENISLAENVAEVQDVSRRQVMIQPHAKLIVVSSFA